MLLSEAFAMAVHHEALGHVVCRLHMYIVVGWTPQVSNRGILTYTLCQDVVGTLVSAGTVDEWCRSEGMRVWLERRVYKRSEKCGGSVDINQVPGTLESV